uniref:tRNA lysidine(34) synthetase TilS n=1 Tax=Flavobacterium sp. TaxID=239 RepID=UPI004047EA3A
MDSIESKVNIPLKLSITRFSGGKDVNSNCIFVDEDKIKFPLTIRKWQEGDEFYPFGMTGKKKLSKYFKDEKYSLLDKENQWLLCSADQIVWVIGKRADNRFKTQKTTQNIIKIEVK